MNTESQYSFFVSIVLILGGFLTFVIGEQSIGFAMFFLGLGMISLFPRISKKLQDKSFSQIRLDYLTAYISGSIGTFILILFILSRI